jgi:DNA-binding IclR family transcriptional regulator
VRSQSKCGLTRATTGHLVRTLAFHRYLMWWEPGRYTIGLAVADRAGDLVRQLELKQRVGVTVAEMARHLDVPVATVERLLRPTR